MTFDWYHRAHKSIAQGSLTNSKRVETMVKGVTPTHVTHGQGPFLFGVDGKKYIDFCCANGTQILGYGHPAIKKVVADQLDRGCLYSLGSTLEVECAELLKEQLPFVKSVRFLKTGTEACMAAVKIARAHTGREKILSSGYHGWSDDFVSLSPPAYGVPFRKNIEQFKDMSQIKDDVAAVIIEPVETDDSPTRRLWIAEVIRKSHANGALVIFDEVITGFRWPEFTFSKNSGLHPDIICLGKAMAGGLPLSAIGIKDKIAENKEWFVSSTHAGELLSLSAFKETVKLLNSQKYRMSELWREGQRFIDEFNALWPGMISIEGYPTRGVLKCTQMTKGLFFQEAHRAGILFGSSWFFGFQHLGLRDQVIATCKDIMQRIKTDSVQMVGELPQSPFAQKVREQ
jgi:glutamate-1-semialdehyde 2,1-aminomutase